MRAVGRFLFAFRGLLPVPGFVALAWVARPTPALFLAGCAVAGLGEAVRLLALRAIGPKSRVSGKIRTEELVTGGIYACVRNPLYAGNFLMGLGMCLAAGFWWIATAYVPVVAVYYHLIIRAEERALGGAFGPAYADYTARTPRLFPALWRWRPLPAGQGHPVSDFLPRETNTLAALVWAAAIVGRRLVGCPY